ncbi:muconolactone Delta-isomerase family protein [Edaphobacter modestus]|uniref:Muconolactone delta-isomerase n=1 Tax=Edaphobacter modestus TaxID=388466 RepID=A0A4V2G1L5_9BACT|nr:muconolactone Delta-isomerase family protein [Edaphobacter modestus]RZU29716.1 muconolactone delta-isomerase [Edaphobacter modestus]
MQFLSISRPHRSFTESQYLELVDAEGRQARTLYTNGTIRQLWHRMDAPGVCILWEANDAKDVKEMLDALPFAKAGIVEFTVIPLKPYKGFGS